MGLKCHSGQEYSDVRSLAAGEYQAGRMTEAQHDALMQHQEELAAAVGAFNWTGIFTALSSLLPILAVFVPGLAPFVTILPLIQQLIAAITGGTVPTDLLKNLIAQIASLFGNILPKPLPVPTPVPVPTPGPGPAPAPLP